MFLVLAKFSGGVLRCNAIRVRPPEFSNELLRRSLELADRKSANKKSRSSKSAAHRFVGLFLPETLR